MTQCDVAAQVIHQGVEGDLRIGRISVDLFSRIPLREVTVDVAPVKGLLGFLLGPRVRLPVPDRVRQRSQRLPRPLENESPHDQP
jgi:hypothetical protein